MENSTLANTPVPRQKKRSPWKFIFAFGVLAAAMVVLAAQAFQTSAMFYLTVPELKAQAAAEGDALYARQVRISGTLHKESIDWNAKTMNLKFHLAEGTEMFPVEYTGVMPDTFHHSETVVAEGKYTPSGVFEATMILVKCPSKYEKEG